MATWILFIEFELGLIREYCLCVQKVQELSKSIDYNVKWSKIDGI